MSEQSEISDDAPKASFFDKRLQMQNWFPKLRELDVPTPESQPIPVEKEEGEPPGWDTDLAIEVVENLGGEAFARSDYKSAAMDLGNGSHVQEPTAEKVDRTLTELVSQHAMMSMPVGENLWLREWLDLNWCVYARDTLHPECRAFIEDGEVLCYHPRLEGFRNYEHHRETAEEFIESAWAEEIEHGYRDHEGLEVYAQRVADAFDGSWSVDFVLDTNGDWYCTDMALRALTDRSGSWAGMSEHPGDCEHDLENIYALRDEPENGSEGSTDSLESELAEMEEFTEELADE